MVCPAGGGTRSVTGKFWEWIEGSDGVADVAFLCATIPNPSSPRAAQKELSAGLNAQLQVCCARLNCAHPTTDAFRINPREASHHTTPTRRNEPATTHHNTPQPILARNKINPRNATGCSISPTKPCTSASLRSAILIARFSTGDQHTTHQDIHLAAATATSRGTQNRHWLPRDGGCVAIAGVRSGPTETSEKRRRHVASRQAPATATSHRTRGPSSVSA